MKNMILMLLTCFFLVGCSVTCPKDARCLFLRHHQDAVRYKLYETSIMEMRLREIMIADSKILLLWNLRDRFPQNKELAAYVEEKTHNFEKFEKLELAEIDEFSAKMHPGDRILRYEYENGDHHEGGVLILTKEGHIREQVRHFGGADAEQHK